MSNTDLLKRTFHFADPVALQKARVFLSCLTRDISDFGAFDSDFNADYLTKFGNLIEAAAAIPDHEYMQDQLAIKTTELKDIMEAARKAFRFMKPFIEKAFPNRKDIWNLFGYDNFSGIRNNQERLTAFIARLHETAVKYSAELIAAGYPQEKIDLIKFYQNNIVKANVDQDDFKIVIKNQTNERIKKMNDMWEVVLHINRIGKLIYEDDYSKYQQYVLYHSSTQGEPDVLQGNVPAGETVVILQENIVPSTVFKLKNPGTTGMEYLSFP
ncbi:MAG: hypothetical protein K8S23_12245 [Candidatus Cloacimonetes bacterium]|nr:hypothetical protein [Candidatus Cloacimonadota bacterium]